MIVSIIPARAGSKRIKNKNIRQINGKPMLVYSVEQSLACGLIDMTFVATDSKKYAKIAEKAGAYTITRQESDDNENDYEMLNFCLNTFLVPPGIIVHLRPTYPYRKTEDITRAVELLQNNPEADSVRSVCKSKFYPQKTWFNIDKYILPFIDVDECHSDPDQSLGDVYLQNACVDVIRTTTITEKHMIAGETVLPYVMKSNYDVNTTEDLKQVRRLMKGGH